jgi:hypothetical protein
MLVKLPAWTKDVDLSVFVVGESEVTSVGVRLTEEKEKMERVRRERGNEKK